MGFLDKIRTLITQLREMPYIMSKNYVMLQSLTMGEGTKHHDSFDDSWSDHNPTICHALGEIDGVLYTECKEAFERHYNLGSRIFELDFCLTKDGKAVILHDWERFKKLAGIESSDSALSHKQFSEAKILGKYTPLDMDKFIGLASKYSDAKFVISVKSANHEYNGEVKKIFGELFEKTDAVDPDIRRRYILHAYSLEFLDKAMTEYPFASVIYRCVHFLHPQVLAEELTKRGVSLVTVLNDIYANAGFCNTMHGSGIKVIACACQKEKKARAAQIKKWKKTGMDMLMIPDGEEINEKI